MSEAITALPAPTTDRPRTWVECLAENDRLRTQVAGLDAEIERQTKTLRDERDHFLKTIKDLHREYVAKDCETCEGKGQVEVAVTCNYPSAHDAFVPAERSELDTCEDCLGTGKEWGI